MRTNPISQQCEHQGTYSLISMESFAHEVRVRVGVRSTDLSSVSQIFLNEMYQLLMDPSHLTTSELLLVCSKLKASLTQSFPNIAAHGNPLGSFKNHCCLPLTRRQCDLIAIGCALGSEIFKCSPYIHSNM